MTVTELLERTRAALAAAADPAHREGVNRFFKETVNAYGVRSPEVKKIEQMAYREVKGWPAAERNRFSNELWRSGRLEEGTVATWLYRRFRRSCAACEFRLFERWIDRYVRNWAHCDGVSSWLLAACIANEPPLMEALPAWAASENRWKRRAAAVSLLQDAKQGRHTEFLLGVAARLMEDPDDMVQKGVGWLLKEAYPKRPREVVAFLDGWKGRTSRVVLRYAAEKMTAADRARVLG